VAREPIACLIVVLGGSVIVKYPARVLFAAGLMDELSNLFLRTPKAPNAAVVAVPTPHLCVDVAISIQRCNKLVPMTG
jgi:hypothetical protein